MDIKGQIALEYLLLFFIIIITISVITLPLLTESMTTTNDMTTAIETKNFLMEVQKNVKLIYSLDYGSKRTFSVYVPCKLNLNYKKNATNEYLTTTLILSDNTRKAVNVEVPCDVSFNGNMYFHYTTIEQGWYYNTEVKWYNSKNGTRSINVNFK